jgi:hypothetical protein
MWSRARVYTRKGEERFRPGASSAGPRIRMVMRDSAVHQKVSRRAKSSFELISFRVK